MESSAALVGRVFLLLVILVPGTSALASQCSEAEINTCKKTFYLAIQHVNPMNLNVFVVCRVFQTYYDCVDKACSYDMPAGRNRTLYRNMEKYGYQCDLSGADRVQAVRLLLSVSAAMIAVILRL